MHCSALSLAVVTVGDLESLDISFIYSLHGIQSLF
jgi:hypothetical protein